MLGLNKIFYNIRFKKNLFLLPVKGVYLCNNNTKKNNATNAKYALAIIIIYSIFVANFSQKSINSIRGCCMHVL